MLYVYKIRYFDESSEQEDKRIGLTHGENYHDAMDKVFDWFGPQQNVIEIYLECLDGELVEFYEAEEPLLDNIRKNICPSF